MFADQYHPVKPDNYREGLLSARDLHLAPLNSHYDTESSHYSTTSTEKDEESEKWVDNESEELPATLDNCRAELSMSANHYRPVTPANWREEPLSERCLYPAPLNTHYDSALSHRSATLTEKDEEWVGKRLFGGDRLSRRWLTAIQSISVDKISDLIIKAWEQYGGNYVDEYYMTSSVFKLKLYKHYGRIVFGCAVCTILKVEEKEAGIISHDVSVEFQDSPHETAALIVSDKKTCFFCKSPLFTLMRRGEDTTFSN